MIGIHSDFQNRRVGNRLRSTDARMKTSARGEKTPKHHSQYTGPHHGEVRRCTLSRANAIVQMDCHFGGAERSHCSYEIRHETCTQAQSDHDAHCAGEELTDLRGRPAAKRALPELNEAKGDDPDDRACDHISDYGLQQLPDRT